MMVAGREFGLLQFQVRHDLELINDSREWAMRVAEKSPEEKAKLIHKAT